MKSKKRKVQKEKISNINMKSKKRKIKKEKKRSNTKSKKRTIKKTNLKLIITAPHWFCLNQDENLCDQNSLIDSKLLYLSIKKLLKNKVIYIKPNKIHRSLTDANRGKKDDKLGIYHPLLKPFLNKIKKGLTRRPKLLLDIHSYSMNNNLPFYLLYIDIGKQKLLCESYALKICHKCNISYNPQMIKKGTFDNEIIRLALEKKSIKLAIIIELSDMNNDYIRNLLIEAIRDVSIEFIEEIL